MFLLAQRWLPLCAFRSVQATAQASLGAALAAAESAAGSPPEVGGVATWHPVWVVLAARKAATYGPPLLAAAVSAAAPAAMPCRGALQGARSDDA